MSEARIEAKRRDIASDVVFGEGVVIECDDLEIGPGSRIGTSEGDGFRTPPGVVIRARRLRLGRGVEIGPSVRIEGGDIELGDGVRVMRHATINVLDRLRIGEAGTLNERAEISGRHVEIGQELWMLAGAKIGGGSAFERSSSLVAGHYLHLGVDTLINTARPVVIGHEVGLGTRTSIYTHGAYPSRLHGFPVAFAGVEIGDFTWVPGATINPGVRIGRCCVIGVNSLVTSDIPDGSLAAGSPAKVIRADAYPRRLSHDETLDFFLEFLGAYADLLGSSAAPERTEHAVALRTADATYLAGDAAADVEGRVFIIGEGVAAAPRRAGVTAFDTRSRRIAGTSDAASARLANELRRHGIRFYSRANGGEYEDWSVEPPAFSTNH